MRMPAAIALFGLGAAVACSSAPSEVTVANTSVDATYSCPRGSSDSPYALHATVDVHNATSSTVTISSVKADMTLEDTKGAWQEKVGENYNAGAAKFTPSSVAAGATATINVTITSTCTNSRSGYGGQDYGDYSVRLYMETSAGTFSDTSKNLHRILAA